MLVCQKHGNSKNFDRERFGGTSLGVAWIYREYTFGWLLSGLGCAGIIFTCHQLPAYISCEHFCLGSANKRGLPTSIVIAILAYQTLLSLSLTLPSLYIMAHVNSCDMYLGSANKRPSNKYCDRCPSFNQSFNQTLLSSSLTLLSLYIMAYVNSYDMYLVLI